ncbi:MAG: hypothetical protein N2448_11435 [Caloramator sp.]|nr:hypothetical protein [Caloramator sp.]
MQDHQKNIDLLNTSIKLCCMSVDNIKWGILYSGAGICQFGDVKDIKRILNPIESSEKFNNTSEDIILLKCSYKKGKPLLDISNWDREHKYMWNPNSFNKTILPASQAYAILGLLKTMEFIEPKDDFLSYLMILTAQNYYDFSTAYMRNEDGLFISVEDKTKNFEEELKIKPIQKEAKLIDQIFMHEALLFLYKSSSKSSNDSISSKTDKYNIDLNNLFDFLFNNCNEIFELSSKELSLAISSFARCIALEEDIERKEKYRLLVSLLCAELESRIKITGEVERGGIDTSVTSVITHFKTVSALLEGYFETKIEKFKDAAFKTYNILLDLYDPVYSLFIYDDYSKISYSIRDICEILKCMFLVYSTTDSEQTLKMITDFYSASIENSNIMQSISSSDMYFKGHNINIKELPDIYASGKAPVFIKSFRTSYKKYPTSLTLSRQFYSFYSFYSSYIFLHYFNQIIDYVDNNENKIPPKIDNINNSPDDSLIFAE